MRENAFPLVRGYFALAGHDLTFVGTRRIAEHRRTFVLSVPGRPTMMDFRHGGRWRGSLLGFPPVTGSTYRMSLCAPLAPVIVSMDFGPMKY